MTKPIVTLTTDLADVVLRELTADDIDAYAELVDRNRTHLNQHGDHQFEHDATLDDIRSYFAHPWDANARFGIRSGGRLVGRVDLNPIDPPRWVLGYWLDASSTGRGIATIACRAALSHVETLGATEVYAGVTNGNVRSVRVLERLGFEHVQDVENRSRWRLPLIADPPPPVMA